MRNEKIIFRTLVVLLVLFQLFLMLARITGRIPTADWTYPIIATVVTLFNGAFTWRVTSDWR